MAIAGPLRGIRRHGVGGCRGHSCREEVLSAVLRVLWGGGCVPCSLGGQRGGEGGQLGRPESMLSPRTPVMVPRSGPQCYQGGPFCQLGTPLGAQSPSLGERPGHAGRGSVEGHQAGRDLHPSTPGCQPGRNMPAMTRGTGLWPPRGDRSTGGQSWRATSQGHWWRGPETAGMTPQESAPRLWAAPQPQHPRWPQAWPLPAAWPRLPRGSPTTGRRFSGSRALQGFPVFVHTVPSAARPFPLCT